MFCYNCGCHLSEHDFCTACGADVSLYKRIMYISNMYYNEGLEKAGIRDLTGAITSLRQSLKFNKNNIEARNLLGLVYFEVGEVVAALSEWVISKNLRPEKNVADDYIEKLQSNSSRLDAINQTIKKYNQALVYCMQDSKDLAVIQLKKVLSLNPRFVRAHQLLALLYMDSEEWERAERELRKCVDIDRNNLQTLRYLKEVEQMLLPDESVRQPARKKKDETVRYRSDNEIIIQPLNVKEPKQGGASTLVNLGLGLVIGIAATYFLVVPAAQTNTRNEMQGQITEISNKSDAKTIQIQELTSEVEKLNREIDALNEELEGIVGINGTLQDVDMLLAAAASYLETNDAYAAEENLEAISQTVALDGTSEGFQSLYHMLEDAIAPVLAEDYFNTGHTAYQANDYVAAIENLSRAVDYISRDYNGEDPRNRYLNALFELARSYHENGDSDDAIAAYDKVMELFPGSNSALNAKYYRSLLRPDE